MSRIKISVLAFFGFLIAFVGMLYGIPLFCYMVDGYPWWFFPTFLLMLAAWVALGIGLVISWGIMLEDIEKALR